MSDQSTPGWGKTIYNFMRSMKLAIVLILFITLTSIVSTLVPQNQDLEVYLATYPRFIAWLVVTMGFDSFFKSFLFLAPSALFFINLSFCTFHRFTTRIRKNAKKRFGPDILHIGLLVMIIGGVVTAIGREEGFAMLDAGDRINVPGGYVLTLENFEFFKYEDGAPKDWVSTVTVEKDGQITHQSVPIEVNKPLKLGNVKLYQSSYQVDSFILVSDPEGNLYQLQPGQMIPVEDEGFILTDIEQDRDDSSKSLAHFDHWQGHEVVGHLDFALEDSIGPYTITKIESSLSTGLQMVIDPGYYPIFIGLLLLTLGLFITYIQKMTDAKL